MQTSGDEIHDTYCNGQCILRVKIFSVSTTGAASMDAVSQRQADGGDCAVSRRYDCVLSTL